jgi:hypothetical protein
MKRGQAIMKKAGYPPAWSPNGPVPRIAERIGKDRIRCRVTLDPEQPCLDHHRPGGDPLLGTVMGIEAMARGARLLCPEGWLARVNDVQIGPPCILEAGASRPRDIEVNARIERRDAHETIVLCEVLPESGLGSSDPHFSGRVHLSRVPLTPVERTNSPGAPDISDVLAEDIYGLFFHGAWFQVIAAAGMREDTMIARYSVAQEEQHGSNYYEADPRTIEFCLQTAGLLELAETGRMTIPHAIRNIERCGVIDEPVTIGLIAAARRSSAEGSNPDDSSIDIDAVDAQGRLHVRVTSYETLPLPFSASEAEVARLQELLRH